MDLVSTTIETMENVEHSLSSSETFPIVLEIKDHIEQLLEVEPYVSINLEVVGNV